MTIGPPILVIFGNLSIGTMKRKATFCMGWRQYTKSSGQKGHVLRNARLKFRPAGYRNLPQRKARRKHGDAHGIRKMILAGRGAWTEDSRLSDSKRYALWASVVTARIATLYEGVQRSCLHLDPCGSNQ